MPIIICPMDIVQNADPGVNFTNVTWPDPRYMDNEEITVFNASHTSGTLFYIATTVVSYLIVDRAGNSANCSFDVTVVGE